MKILVKIIVVLVANLTFAQETQQNKKYDFPRRNSVYIQNVVIYPVLYYDRIIPVSAHFGAIPKLGIFSGLGYGNSIIFESSFFIGGNKHYGEFGVGKWLDNSRSLPININYRYIAKKGFLLKSGYRFNDIYDNFFIVGLGYAF